ncbi:MAG TPA: hypothetical protein QGF05_05470 [Dehalococcoidia bacterium]|nr:hypothetical protein [Dehalococcoidia bacterium]
MELQAGFNLVMWTGPDGTPVADAIGGLGDALRALFTYDGTNQVFRSFRPALPAALNSATTLNFGDGVWIQVARDAAWDQPAP